MRLDPRVRGDDTQLKKLSILIASGATREPLDLVRYLSNYSTGVMGRYLVKAAKKAGHKVTWIECPDKIETALELNAELKRHLPKNDVLIMAAAVCDVRPVKISRNKIKKNKLTSIRLTKNPDILAGLSKRKKRGQVFVGFAVESENIFENASKKLKAKGLDLLVLQRVTKSINPFGDKPIEAYLLEKNKGIQRYGAIRKEKLAGLIVEAAGDLARSACEPGRGEACMRNSGSCACGVS